jgi:hypothetical protein
MWHTGLHSVFRRGSKCEAVVAAPNSASIQVAKEWCLGVPITDLDAVAVIREELSVYKNQLLEHRKLVKAEILLRDVVRQRTLIGSKEQDQRRARRQKLLQAYARQSCNLVGAVTWCSNFAVAHAHSLCCNVAAPRP